MITAASVGGAVYLKVSDDCERGSDVTAMPSDAVMITQRARARDGKSAAVVFCVRRFVSTRMQASRGNEIVGAVIIDVPPPPAGVPADQAGGCMAGAKEAH
jgi:hypothetical protein